MRVRIDDGAPREGTGYKKAAPRARESILAKNRSARHPKREPDLKKKDPKKDPRPKQLE